MKSLVEKLDRLEAHLQTFIEGHLANLLPTQLSQDEFAWQIVAAMQVNIQQQDDGTLLAPDVFHVRVSPQYLRADDELDPLLRSLEELLQQEGDREGFHFVKPPTVSLIEGEDLAAGEIDVLAWVSQDLSGETTAMEVEPEAEGENIPANAFLIVNGTDVYQLKQTVVNIGRHLDNDVVLDDPRVSRRHAQLRAVRGRYIIFDLDSTGGTYVNDRRVAQCVLHPQDVISLAGIPLVYAQEDSAESASSNTPTEGITL